MDFHLTKEQLLVRKMYRDFAENEVKPLAAEIDEEERFPMETVEKMAKLGMMGIYFPKEYGGAGADVLSYAMCVEELAKVCGTTAVIVSAHTSLCAAPIFENGTEEQKMKYLPDLLSGRKRPCRRRARSGRKRRSSCRSTGRADTSSSAPRCRSQKWEQHTGRYARKR